MMQRRNQILALAAQHRSTAVLFLWTGAGMLAVSAAGWLSNQFTGTGELLTGLLLLVPYYFGLGLIHQLLARRELRRITPTLARPGSSSLMEGSLLQSDALPPARCRVLRSSGPAPQPVRFHRTNHKPSSVRAGI